VKVLNTKFESIIIQRSSLISKERQDEFESMMFPKHRFLVQKFMTSPRRSKKGTPRDLSTERLSEYEDKK
jgi:hypothetical protein